MEFLIAAIVLGFLGGFHCVGMCGPIAMALPVHNKSASQKVITILIYNFGRIVTYSAFGLLFGAVGQSFVLFGLQQALSIVLGSLILLFVIISYFGKVNNPILSKAYFFINAVKSKLSNLFSKRNYSAFFSIGLLNGLLPCGLVYMALAGAIATGSIVNGALFMIFFGLGTLPFMFAVTYYSNLISLKVRNHMRKVVPVVVALMAVLMILRGMNLGIDYISPKLTQEKCEVTSEGKEKLDCCHK
jgi:sulfite exporter TauE/SafE